MIDSHSGAPLKILIVEDSPTQAEALRALLEGAGYDSAVARSAEQAVRALGTDRVDMVISDVIMPGKSGYDLCRMIKGDPSTRAIPVVLLTSLADPLDMIRGLECGADSYVTKPYEAEHLLACARQVFANRALRGNQPPGGAVDITFLGTRFTIGAEKEQILDLLISSFEELVRTNVALRNAETERSRLYDAECAARLQAEVAQQLAEEANKAKSDFLAMMSHDLRTPLNAIGGYAELLAMGVRGPVTTEQITDLDRITRNQRHLLALVNDVLSFARVERGEIPVTLTELPLNSALKPLGSVIEPQVRKRGIVYEYVRCERSITVVADRERLEQIMINLLGNAVKFTPDGGRITMSCGMRDDKAYLDVTDTGIGIPANKLDVIFEPFAQVLSTNVGTRDGVGLGLAISRKLARGMGGEITVRSDEGAGSTFTLTLPIAAVHPDRLTGPRSSC